MPEEGICTLKGITNYEKKNVQTPKCNWINICLSRKNNRGSIHQGKYRHPNIEIKSEFFFVNFKKLINRISKTLMIALIG